MRDAISACRGEVKEAFDEAVEKLSKRKNTLLKECDNHESALLEKLDKLTERDSEMVENLSDARDLVGNGVKSLDTGYAIEVHETLSDGLKDLLKTDEPELSEATCDHKAWENDSSPSKTSQI